MFQSCAHGGLDQGRYLILRTSRTLPDSEDRNLPIRWRPTMGGHIRLRGITGATKGQNWDSQELLRIGRLESLEVRIEDASVSRFHAEIRLTPRGWRIRDLG